MFSVNKLFAVFPCSSKFRGKLYKLFKCGTIGDNFHIGFGSCIEAEKISIGNNVKLGNLVRIKNLDEFNIGNNSSIGSSTIVCGSTKENKVEDRLFKCGDDVEILCSHYFDVVSSITIGNHVVVGGKWTQFYTHSFDLNGNRLDGAIVLGDNIYIGAGSIINLGVHVCNKVVIQGGTCVNKDIIESGVYASNSLFRKGNVRNYDELFHEKMTLLKTGKREYNFDK